jgi:gas vesicle protein
MRRFFNFFIGALLGGFAGAFLALLLAPSSGEEMRLEMRERINRLQSEIRQAAVQRRQELEEQLAALRAPASGSPRGE